jgi:hypothetical protein
MAQSTKVELEQTITASDRYQKLSQDRQGFLTRGRDCAKLTIPAILPPEGFSPTSQLPTPYQSLGARGSRNLASKLLLSLFPGIPFFNYKLDDQTIELLGTKRGEIETALASRERAVGQEIDLSVFRPCAFSSLLHLIVTGNFMVHLPTKPDTRARGFRLDQYVTRRDAAGRLLEFVIQEPTEYAALPDEFRATLAGLQKFKEGEKVTLEAQPLVLYTHGYWDHTKSLWVVYQEVEAQRVPGTEGTFKEGELEYIPLRFSYQPGEHYGRGYVEEFLGDMDSLEALSETLVEGSAASARIVFLVNPGGVTSLKVVADAPNGAVVAGDANDVSTLQAEKQADLQVAKSQAEEIANRLSYAFLLHSSVQRQGERVTAEEIRFMAAELDDGLGGVYTLLASDYQLPLVRLLEKRMEKRLKQPKLPTDMVKPVVVTGLEAIGRGHDQRNLQAYVKEIIGTLGPELAMRYLKPLELIKRSAAAYGIDTTNLIPTEQEVAQAEQQAMMQSMVGQLGPQAIQQLGGMGNTMLQGQQSAASQ